MGILNITPDSFSDGGKYLDPDRAVACAKAMIAEGADFIDVGGESSRPGSLPVSVEEELNRVIPIIRQLADSTLVPISVDTTKAIVARQAMEAGAKIINDISALRQDPGMVQVAALTDATVVLMHMQGEPRTMQDQPHYDDLIGEIHCFLAGRVALAQAGGIAATRILIDPGLGFGKCLGDNFELLGRLREFSDLGPILVGPSRKSFIGKSLNLPVDERIFGTAAAVAVATLNGAAVLRVHDVKAMREVVEIAHRCLTHTPSPSLAGPI